MAVRAMLFGVIAAFVMVVSGAAQPPGAFVRTERLGLPPIEDATGAFSASSNGIIGTARGADRSPIPEARLQLRDLRL